MLAFLLIPVILAQVPGIALFRYIKIIEWLGIFAIASAIQFNEKSPLFQRSLLIALLGISVFEFLLSIAQLANKATLQGIFYWFGERAINVTTPDSAVAVLNDNLFLRPYGTFSHPNSMAGFFLLLYFFVLTFQAFKIFPRIRAVTLFISMLIIFITFSKTVIAIFVFINLLVFAGVVLKQRCRFCGVARFIVLIAVAATFALPQGDPFSLAKRISLTDNALEIISQNPITGVGLGNYLYAQSGFYNPYNSYFLQPVHNILLLFLSETGLVVGGVLLFIIFRKINPLFTHKAFLYCFGVVLLSGMMDHYWLTLQQNFLLTALVFGLLSNKSLSIIRKDY
jgi:O-antigen ligase